MIAAGWVLLIVIASLTVEFWFPAVEKTAKFCVKTGGLFAKIWHPVTLLVYAAIVALGLHFFD